MDDPGFECRQGQEILPFSRTSSSAVGPNQLPILCRGYIGRGVVLIAHLVVTRLTFNRLMTYIYIYMSYRTANLQMLHFIYLLNRYTY